MIISGDREHFDAMVSEFVNNVNAAATLPRITEDEWNHRYGWVPNEDGTYLLNHTDEAEVRARDPQLVWSQIQSPDDDDNIWIVPGAWMVGATGWYFCARPWDPGQLCVCVVPREKD